MTVNSSGRWKWPKPALASAKATAERVRVDEARAQAVEQQAQQDHKRISDLVATKVSSQAEMDKAIEQLHVAESDLQRARAATVEAQQQVNHGGEESRLPAGAPGLHADSQPV